MLFIGNSYTARGDLKQVTTDLLVAADARWSDDPWAALTSDGYALPDHVRETTTNGSPWESALVTAPEAWGIVILQDQSQIPGFPQDDPTWLASKAAADELNTLVSTNGDDTWLFQTWGRRDGDADNPTLFPDYSTMQDRLTEGYAALSEALSTPDRPVGVAPVGEAFRIVFDDIIAAGLDPLADGSAFTQLYASDGSHPSMNGTYLAACVITASVSGEPCTGLPSTPSVPLDLVPILQDAADRAVFGDPPEETGPGTGTTVPTSPGTTTANDVASASTGCGCAQLDAGGSAPLGALLVLFLRGSRARR